MDELYGRLREFPIAPLVSIREIPESDIEAQLKKLLKLLNSTAGSKLLGNITSGQSLLDALTLPHNTLPYLYTLLAHIQSQNGLSPTSPLWFRAQEFVLSFDPLQVRYAGHEFRRLLEAIAYGAEVFKSPAAATILIQQALLRLDPGTSTFTSLHLLFARLCLVSRAYTEALPILDNNIYHIAPLKSGASDRQNRALCSSRNPSPTFITQEVGFSTSLEYSDHLLYYLYGAMIYVGAKKRERALSFLETVMLSPAINTASMIQVEACKKWILVSLLQHGKVPYMPRGVNIGTAKLYRAIGKPYEALAEAFKNADPQKLRDEVRAGEKIWQNDSNTGLVLLLLSANQRFAVQSLSRIYSSLPLSTVYTLVFPPHITLEESHIYITELVASNQLNAHLTKTDHAANAILRFTNPTSPSSISAAAAAAKQDDLDKTPELQEQKARIEALSERMRDTRHRLEITRQYAEALAKARKADADAKAGVGAGSSNGIADFVKDEELLDTV